MLLNFKESQEIRQRLESYRGLVERIEFLHTEESDAIVYLFSVAKELLARDDQELLDMLLQQEKDIAEHEEQLRTFL